MGPKRKSEKVVDKRVDRALRRRQVQRYAQDHPEDHDVPHEELVYCQLVAPLASSDPGEERYLLSWNNKGQFKSWTSRNLVKWRESEEKSLVSSAQDHDGEDDEEGDADDDDAGEDRDEQHESSRGKGREREAAYVAQSEDASVALKNRFAATVADCDDVDLPSVRPSATTGQAKNAWETGPSLGAPGGATTTDASVARPTIEQPSPVSSRQPSFLPPVDQRARSGGLGGTALGSASRGPSHRASMPPVPFAVQNQQGPPRPSFGTFDSRASDRNRSPFVGRGKDGRGEGPAEPWGRDWTLQARVQMTKQDAHAGSGGTRARAASGGPDIVPEQEHLQQNARNSGAGQSGFTASYGEPAMRSEKHRIQHSAKLQQHSEGRGGPPTARRPASPLPPRPQSREIFTNFDTDEGLAGEQETQAHAEAEAKLFEDDDDEVNAALNMATLAAAVPEFGRRGHVASHATDAAHPRGSVNIASRPATEAHSVDAKKEKQQLMQHFSPETARSVLHLPVTPHRWTDADHNEVRTTGSVAQLAGGSHNMAGATLTRAEFESYRVQRAQLKELLEKASKAKAEATSTVMIERGEGCGSHMIPELADLAARTRRRGLPQPPGPP